VSFEDLRLDGIEVVAHFDTLNRAAFKADHVVVVIRFIEDFVSLHPLEEIDLAYDPFFKKKVKLTVDGRLIDLQRPTFQCSDQLRSGYRPFMTTDNFDHGATHLGHSIARAFKLL